MEKLRQIMDERCKFNKENKTQFTEKFFEEAEKRLSFGIDAYTEHSPQKEIHKSVCSVVVKVVIKNPRAYDIVRIKKDHMESLKCKVEKEMVLVDKKSQLCFGYDKKGVKIPLMKRTALSMEEYHFIDVDVNDPNDIEEFENLYEHRIAGMKAICAKFGTDARDCCFAESLACRNIAYEKLKYFHGVDNISEKESKIIHGSCRGQLIFADKGKIIEKGFKFDINSMYPFLMMRDDFYFPIEAGMKRSVKQPLETKECKMEIYKLTIKGKHRYWANTPDNYYNTYQIELLDLLKIPYVVEGKKKWIYNCVRGSEVFGYLKDIYDMKTKGNQYAKNVMNCTWGSLSMKKEYKIKVENMKDSYYEKLVHFDLRKGWAVLKGATDRPYKHATGRLKSFLLAFARLFMVKNILLPLEQKGFKIYQVNTDGFITDAEPNEMSEIYPMSKNIGDLKLEKEFRTAHKVKHVNCVEEEYDDGDLDDGFD